MSTSCGPCPGRARSRSAAKRERQHGTTAVGGGFREDRFEMVLDRRASESEHPARDFRGVGTSCKVAGQLALAWAEGECPGEQGNPITRRGLLDGDGNVLQILPPTSSIPDPCGKRRVSHSCHRAGAPWPRADSDRRPLPPPAAARPRCRRSQEPAGGRHPAARASAGTPAFLGSARARRARRTATARQDRSAARQLRCWLTKRVRLAHVAQRYDARDIEPGDISEPVRLGAAEGQVAEVPGPP